MKTTSVPLTCLILITTVACNSKAHFRSTPTVGVTCTVFDIPKDELDRVLKDRVPQEKPHSPFQPVVLEKRIWQKIVPTPANQTRFLAGLRTPSSIWPSHPHELSYSHPANGRIRSGRVGGFLGTDILEDALVIRLESTIKTEFTPDGRSVSGRVEYEGRIGEDQALLFFAPYSATDYHAVAFRIQREHGRPISLSQGHTGGYSYEVASYGSPSGLHQNTGDIHVSVGTSRLEIKNGRLYANGRNAGNVQKQDFIQLDADGRVTVNGDKRELSH